MNGNTYFFNKLDESLKSYSETRKEKINIVEITEIHEEIDQNLTNKDYHSLMDNLIKIENRYPGLKTDELKNYIKMKNAKVLNKSNIKVNEKSEGIIMGFLDEMQPNEKKIFVYPEPISYSECKQYMRFAIKNFYETTNEKVFDNRFIYPFFISENINLKGNIILKRSMNPEIITLISNFIDNEDKIQTQFFGEKIKAHSTQYDHPFYVYTFESDTRGSYIVLTKKDIMPQHCEIRGMLLNVTDMMKIGANSLINTNQNVIIATEIKEDIQKISEKEFYEITKDWDHESMCKILLNEIRHPMKFEKLLFAWLFSCKINDYPLHLFWIAKPGTGKSYILDAIIGEVFKETQGVADGSNVPFKFFIPSYGNVVPEPGYIVRCNRLAGIDELFRSLNRGATNEQLGYLTSLLEHKIRPIGSGKHNSFIPIKATARVMFASNPMPGKESIGQLFHTIDKAVMSRCLLYIQTKYHVDFIRSRRIYIMGKKQHEAMPKYDPNFIEVTDYLQSFMVEIPMEEVQKIFNKYREYVPQDILDSYDARYVHHLACLIDGISKYNSLVEKREKIMFKEKDLVDAEEIFSMCINSWLEDAEDPSKLEYSSRIDHLPLPAVRLYEYIKQNKGISLYEAGNALQMNPYSWINVLKEWLLIKEVEEEKDGKKVKRYYLTSDIDEICMHK
jgi:hypothetical protein